MLETIRELAAEQLAAAGETSMLRRRHAEHYLEVARVGEPRSGREGQQRHELVIPERDNMRAALAWALETGEPDLGLELVVALENYWATSHPEEGVEWAVALLRQSVRVPTSANVARALRVQGGMQNVDRPARGVGAELGAKRSRSSVRLGDERGRRHPPAPVLEHGDPARGRRRVCASFAEESLAGHRRAGRFPRARRRRSRRSRGWRARKAISSGRSSCCSESWPTLRGGRLPLVALGNAREHRRRVA